MLRLKLVTLCSLFVISSGICAKSADARFKHAIVGTVKLALAGCAFVCLQKKYKDISAFAEKVNASSQVNSVTRQLGFTVAPAVKSNWLGITVAPAKASHKFLGYEVSAEHAAFFDKLKADSCELLALGSCFLWMGASGLHDLYKAVADDESAQPACQPVHQVHYPQQPIAYPAQSNVGGQTL